MAGCAAGEDGGGSAAALLAGLGFELAHPARPAAAEADAPAIIVRRVRMDNGDDERCKDARTFHATELNAVFACWSGSGDN